MDRDWLIGWVGTVAIVLSTVVAITIYQIKAIGKDSDPGRTERERLCVSAGGTFHAGECVRCGR